MTHRQGNSIYLGLGSNLCGPWGGPGESLARAHSVLEGIGAEIIAVSRVYESAALGPGIQPGFLNSVVAVRCDLSPAALVRELKSIEQAAGRRVRGRWSARPLDIDILDYRGLILNWKRCGRTARGTGLILPHPEMAVRAFVLKPLAELAPSWRHPVLGRSVSQFIAALEPEVFNSAQPV